MSLGSDQAEASFLLPDPRIARAPLLPSLSTIKMLALSPAHRSLTYALPLLSVGDQRLVKTTPVNLRITSLLE